MTFRARARWGASTIWPLNLKAKTPRCRCSSKAAASSSRLGHRCRRRRERLVDDGDLLGMDGDLAGEPMATRVLALARGDPRGRRCPCRPCRARRPGRRCRHRAHRPREAGDVEVPAFASRTRGNPMAAPRSSMPHEMAMMRGLAVATSRMFSRPSGVSVAIGRRRTLPAGGRGGARARRAVARSRACRRRGAAWGRRSRRGARRSFARDRRGRGR